MTIRPGLDLKPAVAPNAPAVHLDYPALPLDYPAVPPGYTAVPPGYTAPAVHLVISYSQISHWGPQHNKVISGKNIPYH